MGNCSAAPSPESEPSSLNPINPKDSTTSPASASASSGKDVKLLPNNGQNLAAAPKNLEDLRQKGGGLFKNVSTFTYAELRAATKNFRPDKVIGEGGFGVVYKGSIIISSNNGDDDEAVSTTVAVKQLNPEGFQGDREWLAEVNYLGQLSHPNLVKLIGYCCEGTQRLLVYEYMACGSLEKHLFRRVCLTMPWSTRIKIALGAAKGLAFLHSAQRPIIYRDFKTSNILLDADYNAKLSDFGLAKEGPIGDQTHVSTRVVGTYGYAAPEYVMTGHLTARSDVYGFGVVLLEMLIGRKAVDSSRPSREHNLVDWARPLLVHNKKLLKIVDPRMEGQYTTKTLVTVANLTYQCLSQNPKGRPEMHQVVETIENIQNLPEIKGDLLLNNGDAAVTLFEAPRENSDRGTTMARDVNEKRKMRPANGRSKSEPPKELQLYL